MTNNELELRRLIFGTTNTIVVSGNAQDMLTQIHLIRSSLDIEGFIFKPDFATKKKLTAFTPNDWNAMLAQYSITYSWQDIFKGMTSLDPDQVLQDYVNAGNSTYFKKDQIIPIVEKPYNLKTTDYYLTFLQDLANSKTVLREQQIRIINLMPIATIEQVFNSSKFTIKETEILFIKRLIASGSNQFKFQDPDQIVRFLVSSFSTSEPVVSKLNKTILKSVKLKIPTSIKKKIWKDINNMHATQAIQSMKKYQQFWKRIFKQIKFTSNEKTTKRFPKASILRNTLFTSTIFTNNTAIENNKQLGFYGAALTREMYNPGQMMRNLLQYLRYPQGAIIASKKPQKPLSYIDIQLGNLTANSRIVRSDVSSILQSKEFYNTLLKVNPKLLWQVYGMVKKSNTQIFEPKQVKTMNKVKVKYSTQLPGLDPHLTKLARKAIKNAIKQVKRKQNESLSNVYLEPAVHNYSLQFSGREDTSISLSGEYLPSGSRIDLNSIIPDKDLDKSILRIGLAWRGQSSCDIDLSMNVDGHGSVYYGNNSLVHNNDVIIASSGDITSCSNNAFSVEFIDIDLKLFKRYGYSKMFNSAIIYSGNTFADYECYWFMNVIKRKDRINPGAKVQFNLNDLQYATQITESNKTMIGLSFDINEGYAEVLNVPLPKGQSYNNASNLDNTLREAIESMPPRQTIGDALEMCINKQQFVDDIEFANVIISTQEPVDLKDDQVWLHPGRDAIKIQELIY